MPTTNFYAVSQDYFTTMGIPLLRGRGIAASDGPDTERVVVISDTLATRVLRHGGPRRAAASRPPGPQRRLRTHRRRRRRRQAVRSGRHDDVAGVRARAAARVFRGEHPRRAVNARDVRRRRRASRPCPHARPEPAGGHSADDGVGARRVDWIAALHGRTSGCVRRGGAPARGDWRLRPRLVHGGPASPGDWPPHRAGRAATSVLGLVFRQGLGLDPRWDRPRAWRRVSGGRDSSGASSSKWRRATPSRSAWRQRCSCWPRSSRAMRRRGGR